MADWRDLTIGDLCDAGEAELQTGPVGSQLHAYDYLDEGVPVVPTEGRRDRQVDHSVLPRISSTKAEELRRHRLTPGDILFARRGVQATGHVGYVREVEDGFICGTGAIRLRVSGKDRTVTAEFLSHVFANPASIEWFKFYAIGATMPNLNEGIIRAFPLRVPPIAEQRAIAQILSALDDKIELNRRMNETLEATARALFKSWFVDFDPVRAKAEGRDPGLPKPLADLFPERFDVDRKPTGWRWEPLLMHARLISGGTPKTEIADYWDGDIPWASAKDVSQCADLFLTATERRITDRGLDESATRIVPKLSTVVVARGATTGRFRLFGRDMAMNQTCYALQTRNKRPFWLATAFAGLVDALVHAAHGSVFDTITTKTLESARVIVGDYQLVDAFEETVAPLYRRLLINCEQSRTLAALRDTLLPKLISGELRVKDVERFVERAA